MSKELNHNIVIALERISEAFKTLLWDKAKLYGLSPIQIQVLLFVAHHKSELSNVSHLAKEFNLTKPTISDAVKALSSKGYIEKEPSSVDSRSYTLLLSADGQALIQALDSYSQPLERILSHQEEQNLNTLYATLTKLIFQLNKNGVLSVQRTCFGCKFYSKTESNHFCTFLQKELIDTEIRLDCPEFESVEN
ncbi:MarR family transcriptional regulator [Roseivirga seohaensis subsp. aquiponti]|uniref:MarR family transcriptional regulator n=1 Tax=Roseivirga seohaensis subsp. aquiponti TaxID=1566026 RepID=A0A0L8AHC2_9BACT|nr:MarR family transcriptional regulator [Roseivirga seohaensis]KOF01793.1 MarR family transcriptional regulator [Roseivirga seohaensis subsp. aquiponti]